MFAIVLGWSLARAETPTPGQAADDSPSGRSSVLGSARQIFPQESQYRIGVEDLLLVTVWRDPDLTKETPVRPDGMISLPLIQDIPAAGKTPEELGKEIEQRLHEFLSNPSVTVVVREINSLKIFVLGEVVRPGTITIRSKTRLLQAIAMAGGVTPFGGKNGILIYRTTRDGERVIKTSYRDLISGHRPDNNIVLEVGDTVVVR